MLEQQEEARPKYPSYLFQHAELHVLPCCPEQLHCFFVCPGLQRDSVYLQDAHDTIMFNQTARLESWRQLVSFSFSQH